MSAAYRIPIHVSVDPAARGPQPIQMGIPLPVSLVRGPGDLTLLDSGRNPVHADLHPLSRWPDGSLKWLLLRFVAAGDPGRSAYSLEPDSAGDGAPFPAIRCRESADGFTVETGAATFTVSKDSFHPWSQAAVDGKALLRPESVPYLAKSGSGRDLRFRAGSAKIAREGTACLDLEFEGNLEGTDGKPECRVACRLSFFAGTALSRARFTLWNPKPANHPGGLWDLGDPGSVLFRSFSLPIRFAPDSAAESLLSMEPGLEALLPCPESAEILQASSGGENWRSRNHVNPKNEIPLRWRGYRATNGARTEEGLRANPAGLIRHASGMAAFAMERFWQAFPGRIALTPVSASLEPWPGQEGEPYELQGGEKATFSLWADFRTDPDRPGSALSAARLPALATVAPEWMVGSGCVSGLSLPSPAEDPFFVELEASCLAGEVSLPRMRETFDEYGWRNFGEVAADHEKLHYRGEWEFVSHYNNQYDLVLSFLRESLRTENPVWNDLGMNLARHVVDHDLYHTSSDKQAYNGGYFWHTAHYAHAGTATHRTFSRLCAEGGPPPAGFGGGPSNEHNYTSGLLLHYWLTGDEYSKEAVLMLARWVRDMQNGSGTPLRFLSRNPTGLSTCTRELDYQGPGRGAGYSINACLDAFAVSGEEEWLGLAESFIHICIHPEDDCSAMGLLDRENRWSYVVFLQILAKYLDVKSSLGRQDADFRFARASLLHYADWMAAMEVPYLSAPEQLEYPTSTWAAQDLRKTDVFLAAARYAEPGKAEGYLERAGHFHDRAKEYLATFADRGSVRNMAIILYSLPSYREFKAGRLACLDLGVVSGPYPPRIPLVPQKTQFLRNAKRIAFTGGLAGIAMFFRFALKRLRSAG